MVGISRTDSNVRTLPSMRKTFISIDERRCQTYVTDAHGTLNDCLVERALGDGQIELLIVPTKAYEDFEEVE